MAKSVKLGPEDDNAVPDKGQPDLTASNIALSGPPLTAQPAASGPGNNLTQLATPDLQTTGKPGELAGQAPLPLANIGTTPAPSAPNPPAVPTAIPASPAAPPETRAAQALMSPDDIVKSAKGYTDELRRRTDELYSAHHPGVLASGEDRLNAYNLASQIAEREMSPKFLGQIATSNYNQGKLRQGEENIGIKGELAHSKENQQGAQADLARGKLSVLGQQVEAQLGRVDAQKYKAFIYGQVAPIIANAQNRQAAAVGVKSLIDLAGAVDDKKFDTGAFQKLQDAVPEAAQKYIEFFRGTAPDQASPNMQLRRNLLGQATGLVNQGLGTGGALPQPAPVGGATPPAAGPPQVPGLGIPPMAAQHSAQATQDAVNQAVARGRPAGMPPVIAAPQPSPLAAASAGMPSPAAQPRSDGGFPDSMGDGMPPIPAGKFTGGAVGASADNILTMRPGSPGGVIAPGGSAKPQPVTGNLNEPANEPVMMSNVSKLKGLEGLDEGQKRQAVQEAVSFLQRTGNKPDAMPPSKKWQVSYYVVHGQKWKPPQ